MGFVRTARVWAKETLKSVEAPFAFTEKQIVGYFFFCYPCHRPAWRNFRLLEWPLHHSSLYIWKTKLFYPPRNYSISSGLLIRSIQASFSLSPRVSETNIDGSLLHPGGADTTVSTEYSFYLAMVLNPGKCFDFQRRKLSLTPYLISDRSAKKSAS